jgi:DNA topoisomerase-1
MSPADVELELALKLLSLPRDIGPHPEDGEVITAGIGRFGPFVRHGKTYASLEAGDDVYHVGLNRAITLIAEKVAKGPSRRFGADPGKEVGDYPARGGKIMLKKGRYGAYVTIDGINATIPDSIEPEKLTIAEAIALIEERATKTGGKAKRGATKKATKKAPKSAAKAGDDAPSKAREETCCKKKAVAKKAASKKEVAEPVSLKEAAAAKAKASKVAAAKVTKVAERRAPVKHADNEKEK